MCGYK